MEGKIGQERGGHTAVEQEGGLHQAADAGFAAVEIPDTLQLGELFLTPLDQVGVFVDHELDSVRHGFQTRERHQTLHRSRQHVERGLPEGSGLDIFRINDRGEPAHLGHNQPNRHDNRHHHKNTEHGENHPGRFTAPANGQVPGGAHQQNAQPNPNQPIEVVEIEDGE